MIVESERHHVQIEKHVGQDDDADNNAEAEYPKAIGIKDIPIYANKFISLNQKMR